MMFKSLVASSLFAFAAAQTSAGSLTINTPAQVVQCQPALLSWTGGSAPYWVTVIPAGQAGAASLQDIASETQDTQVTWTVSLAAGTNISLQLRDGSGAIQFSSPVVIQAGTSDSCLNATATSLAAAATATGATGGAGAATGTVTGTGTGTGAGSTPTTAGTNAASGSKSATASPSASGKSAGYVLAASIPVLGLAAVGAFVAAL